MRLKPEISVTRNTTWTLSNLCRGKPATNIDLLLKAIEPLSKVIVENNQNEIVTDACWALSYIMEGTHEEHLMLFTKEALLNKLIMLINYNSLSVQLPVIRAISKIS